MPWKSQQNWIESLKEDLGDGLWREWLGARGEVVVERGDAQLREEEELLALGGGEAPAGRQVGGGDVLHHPEARHPFSKACQ